MIKYINTYMIYVFLALFGSKSIESISAFKKTLTVNLKSKSKTLSYLSVDNPNSANGTAVLFFVGYSDIGGIWEIIPECAEKLRIYAENLRRIQFNKLNAEKLKIIEENELNAENLRREQVDELKAENLRRIEFDTLNAKKLERIKDNELKAENLRRIEFDTLNAKKLKIIEENELNAENLRREQVDELKAENLRRIEFDELNVQNFRREQFNKLNAEKLERIEDNELSNISKFIMVQWPGVKFDGYESDPIEDSSLALVKEDMEILKELKKENNGRLHVVGFSWGGLRAMTAYLSLSEEDRKGISLSLIDPYIPTLATGEYDFNFIYPIRRIIPNRILNKGFNKMMSSNEAAATILIKHCWAQEKEMRGKLQGINDKILDIRGIYLMTSENGLARSRKYTEFFKDKVVPKCLIKKTNDYEDIFFTYKPGFPVLINHEHLFFPDNPEDFLRSINRSLNNDFYSIIENSKAL